MYLLALILLTAGTASNAPSDACHEVAPLIDMKKIIAGTSEGEVELLSLLQMASQAVRPRDAINETANLTKSVEVTSNDSAGLPSGPQTLMSVPVGGTAARNATEADQVVGYQGRILVALQQLGIGGLAAKSDFSSTAAIAVLVTLVLCSVCLMASVTQMQQSSEAGASLKSGIRPSVGGAEGVLASRMSLPPAGRSSVESSRRIYGDVPSLYPPLVTPVAHTRLCIPLDPLADPHFEFDVLGFSGSPLLSATMGTLNGVRCIRISLHSSNTCLAVVTQSLQILNANGALFGSISRGPEGFVFRNVNGNSSLSIIPGKSAQEVRMLSSGRGQHAERASVTRKPAGHLPAEHYELLVYPDVDAVLMLAVFLALAIFQMPAASSQPPTIMTSSRMSFGQR